MTNLSLGKAGLTAGIKIKNVKNLINAYREGKNNLADIKKEFKAVEKKLSANAGGTSNLVIILWALIITTAWMVCIEFMSVELVSAIAVLALTTVLELVEAFKGPSEKNVEEKSISKNEISSLYNQIKGLIPSIAK
jgi:Flp pilus assembly protein TadB